MSDIRGTYPERLQQLNLTTLEERRVRGDAIETYKYLRQIWNVDSSNLFNIAHSDRPITRQQHSFMPLKVPRARLELRKNFFSVRSAKLWNDIPSEIREAGSVNIFKNMYDRNLWQKILKSSTRKSPRVSSATGLIACGFSSLYLVSRGLEGPRVSSATGRHHFTETN